MRNKVILIILVGVAVCVAAIVLMQPATINEKEKGVSERLTARDSHEPHKAHALAPVPAHFSEPPTAGALGPTLPPDRFIGKTREAYRVANKIPQTLAQLPCYCHCDKSVGHKSLHSCFEDEHAASCAVCVDEALLAYKLQNEEKMTPKQVRDVIIGKYSANR